MTSRALFAASALLFAGACGDNGNNNNNNNNEPTILTTELVASGLDSPVYLAAAPGDARLFVVEQAGVIQLIKDGAVQGTPFLDIQDRVGFDGNERGLFSVAFHPNFAKNGKLYVNYTDVGGDITVSEFTVSADPDVADPNTEVELVSVEHSQFGNHNGGTVQFGPDGFLYISTGDGGFANDPFNASQDVTSLLGKMLRIDVDNGGAPAPGNPFGNEVFQLGLRNPFRFSFDRETGDMYIGDVGQDAFEEWDFAAAGAQSGVNWGWSCLEGLDFTVNADQCGAQADFTAPIIEISQNQGVASAIGGYVYRGAAAEDLQGTYFFTDAFLGTVLTTKVTDGVAGEIVDISDQVGEFDFPVSFGEDAAGELYILTLGGDVFKFVPEE